MIKFKDGAHYYQCRDAEPTPQHDATLREARKLLLYPSITTIDKNMFKNDGLDRYKAIQLARAAYRHPRMEHETEETYAQRIYEASLEHSMEAADFGKEVHDAIEHYPQMPLNQEIAPYMDKFGAWYDQNIESVLHREKILFDHELGLAGRCDFIGISKRTGKLIIPDWKTQDVKKNPKGKKIPGFYDSWSRQLAFYGVCFAKEQGLSMNEIPELVSVVIDSNEPETPFTRVWTPEEVRSSYEEVVIAAYSFFKKRDYWPHLHGKPSIITSVALPYE